MQNGKVDIALPTPAFTMQNLLVNMGSHNICSKSEMNGAGAVSTPRKPAVGKIDMSKQGQGYLDEGVVCVIFPDLR